MTDPSLRNSSTTKGGSGASGATDSGTVTREPTVAQFKKRFRWMVLTALGVLIVGYSLWTWIAVTFPFATGEKRGYVQKLIRTGWLCKTWEGELAVQPIPGTAVGPSVFAFSIRDDSVASALQRASGQLVTVQFGQHRGIPTTCFGETEVFVTGFKIVP